MSEYELLVVSTVCGVIGAVADVAIVILMIRGEPQGTAAHHRRYWPWLLAMLLVTIATASPAYLTYRLATGTLQPVSRVPNAPNIDPRDPTSKEADVIRDLAIKGSFRVNVYCLMTERDSCRFAKKWMNVLDTAGWQTGALNETDFGKPTSGLSVCVSPNSNDSFMAKGEFELALRENSIPVSDECPDPTGLAKEAHFDFAFLVGGP